MLRPIIRTIIALLVLAWYLPTLNFSNTTTLVIAAVVLTLLNFLLKPILKILFLPINIITLGLFSGLITIFLLWLTTYLVPGFEIQPMVILGVPLNDFLSLVVISFAIGFLQSLVGFFL